MKSSPTAVWRFLRAIRRHGSFDRAREGWFSGAKCTAVTGDEPAQLAAATLSVAPPEAPGTGCAATGFGFGFAAVSTSLS